MICVGSRDQHVYALKDGKKIWEFETGGMVTSSPCLGPDDTLYVGSHDKSVYALSRPDQMCSGDAGTVPVDRGDGGELILEDGWILAGDVRLRVSA